MGGKSACSPSFEARKGAHLRMTAERFGAFAISPSPCYETPMFARRTIPISSPASA